MFEKRVLFFVKRKRIVNKTKYKVLAHYEKLNSTNTLKEKQEALMQFRLLHICRMHKRSCSKKA